ncbi:Aspartate aminotransferase [Rhizoctonia solani]|uniref:Aspartate aminotransferase n=1 Tax=Rhizoctonia solani TaxID=456999 RepID=A0A8H7IJ73_9AGAM|nr:Aspartate aminotransferase [Rhizoctonia solani]
MSSASTFAKVPLAPRTADTFPQKVNLGVGAYRDDDNKPWVLPVVKKATEILLNDPALDHEYLPITGLPEYTSAAAKLILGADSPRLQKAALQGTGANHLGALFLSRFYEWTDNKPQVFVSDPTWINHFAIMRNVQIDPLTYPYYDPKTIGLDFSGLLNSLKTAPVRSVFLLHACAHNPTGVDPTHQQWEEIANVFLEKGHYVFFDSAYQGFASGDLDKDAWAVRYFVERGVPLLLCQSFAKNAGLYGERVGALHVVSPTQEEANRVKSQLSVLQRSEISNPRLMVPAWYIALILNDPTLFDEWKRDIKTMAHRIIAMREELYNILTNELKTPGNWNHITDQIGMFSFTGISPEQSQQLIDKAHIYLTANGRISMAGLNSHNLRYFAESLDKVVRGTL